MGVMMKPAVQRIFCPLDKADSTAALEWNPSVFLVSAPQMGDEA
jgi:hypothetical protein